MDKLVVKFESTIMQETVGYDIYKTFQDLFLPGEKRDNMIPKGFSVRIYARFAQNLGTRIENLWLRR